MVKSRLLAAIRIVAAVAIVAGFAGVITTPVDPLVNRAPGSVTRTAGFQPGGKFTAVNASLHMLVIAAYRGAWPLPTGSSLLTVEGGDAWTRTDGFDIEANAQGDPSLDEMEQMLRTVLVEQFVLKAHEETRQVPAYNLVMARKDGKLGPQLRP